MWDARSHGLLQHYSAHDGPVASVAIEPSTGHYLASAGARDGCVKLYDLRQGQLLYTLTGHAGGCGGVAFKPGVGETFELMVADIECIIEAFSEPASSPSRSPPDPALDIFRGGSKSTTHA